jgi:hypothetical protein
VRSRLPARRAFEFRLHTNPQIAKLHLHHY